MNSFAERSRLKVLGVRIIYIAVHRCRKLQKAVYSCLVRGKVLCVRVCLSVCMFACLSKFKYFKFVYFS